MLDILSLFLLVELVDDSLLNISFSESRQNCALRAHHQLGGNLRCKGLFFHDLVDWGIFVLLEHIDVSVVDVVDNMIINFT